jgi:hypothetical protein
LLAGVVGIDLHLAAIGLVGVIVIGDAPLPQVRLRLVAPERREQQQWQGDATEP